MGHLKVKVGQLHLVLQCSMFVLLALTDSSYAQTSSKEWVRKAIPTSSVQTTTNYHSRPVQRSAREFNEPLVKVSDYGIASEAFYARKDGLNAPYYRAMPGATDDVWCRKTVAEKLAQVNKNLAGYGLELFVLDAWRSIECQQALWRYFVGRAKQLYPRAGEAFWNEYAAKYCSDPRRFKANDERTWTVHVTGGAIDLTLRRKKTGELLFMGAIFDDASNVSSTAYFEPKPQNESALEARRNRRLLYHSMIEAGFTNYPAEWWHFDYGDQMWSLMRGGTTAAFPAFYGPALLPALDTKSGNQPD